MLHRLNFVYAVLAAVVLFAGALYAGDMEDTNTAQMKKFYQEVVNNGKLDLIDDMCTADFIEHEELPGAPKCREGVKEWFKMFRAAFPDLKFKTEMMIAKDDMVITYVTMTGTHKGEFMGKPASGKTINVPGVDFIRFVDGKAVEHWGVTDTGAMMRQISDMPKKEMKK